MNPLTGTLPTAIEIDGTEYPIRPDFGTAIRIMGALEDNELTEEEKLTILVSQLYLEMPKNIEKAVKMAIKFMNCGAVCAGTDDSAPRLYSFEQDAKYIYSAIRQTYGIDLERERDLHWWKFCCLFGDLSEDCFFSNMLSLRRRKQAGKLTKDEATLYAQLKEILDLPEVRSAEEQIAYDEFMGLLKGG